MEESLKNINKKEYISLHKASKYCPYSQDYLSLRARQGKLKAIKLGRNWVTTIEWIDDYIEKTQDFFEKKGLRKIEKSLKKPLKILCSDASNKGNWYRLSDLPIRDISQNSQNSLAPKNFGEQAEKNKKNSYQNILSNTKDSSILNKNKIIKTDSLQKTHFKGISLGLTAALSFLVLIFYANFLGNDFITGFMGKNIESIRNATEHQWIELGQAALIEIDYQNSVLKETFKIFGEYFAWLGQGVLSQANNLIDYITPGPK